MRVRNVRIRHVALGIAAAAAALVPLACGDDSGDDSSTATTQAAGTQPSATSEATITIENFEFKVLPAKAGTITIDNKDSAEHTVTADDGSFSVNVPGKSTATIEVDSPGTYPFHCNIHSTMKGSLVVT